MACDKPGDGDCTQINNCSGCTGCGSCQDSTPAPVLPRCQDVSLAPGVYQYATIVVNSNGCISSVAAGDPPVYTPDDCCGPTDTATKLAAGISSVLGALQPAVPVATVSTQSLEDEVARLNNELVDLRARLAALEAKVA